MPKLHVFLQFLQKDIDIFKEMSDKRKQKKDLFTGKNGKHEAGGDEPKCQLL